MKLLKVNPDTRAMDVLKQAFPDKAFDGWNTTVDDVELRLINKGSIYHSRFGGIQLKVYSRHQSVIRKVLVKDGQIDLDAIKTKWEDLKVIAEEMQKAREQSQREYGQREAKITAFNLRHGYKQNYDSPARIREDRTFQLNFVGLTEEQANRIVTCYQEVTK